MCERERDREKERQKDIHLLCVIVWCVTDVALDPMR